MRLTYLAAAAAAAALVTAPAWALPSAKATFTYVALNEVVEATGACDSYETECTAEELASLANGTHRVMSATIKMPKWKDLLIDVSLECGNFLETEVRSKGGDKNVATAEATVRVLVLVNDGTGWAPAMPAGNPDRDLDGNGVADGPTEGVVFCHRFQELEAAFQGIFTLEAIGWVGDEDGVAYGDDLAACEAGGDAGQTCTYDARLATCLENDPDFGIVADLSCFTPEEVRLTTASMTANAFNFMYPNTNQSGVHQVSVIAYLDAGRGLSGDAPSGSSTARAMVGLGSMSVQTVRMVKGGIPAPNSADCSEPDACPELD